MPLSVFVPSILPKSSKLTAEAAAEFKQEVMLTQWSPFNLHLWKWQIVIIWIFLFDSWTLWNFRRLRGLERWGEQRCQVPQRLLHVLLRVPGGVLALLAAHVLLLLLRKMLWQEAIWHRGCLSIVNHLSNLARYLVTFHHTNTKTHPSFLAID